MSDAAIEAGAQVLEDHRYIPAHDGPAYCAGCDWESRQIGIASTTQHATHRAAAAYDAMAPLIRAAALRDAAKDAEYELDIVGEPKETAPSSWLRARAEAEGDGRGL